MFDWLWGRKREPEKRGKPSPRPVHKDTSVNEAERTKRVSPAADDVVGRTMAKHWVKDLDSSNDKTRLKAMNELARIGAGAVPVLVEVLGQSPVVRVQSRCYLVAKTLGMMGPAASAAALALRHALGDSYAPIRCAAAETLGNIGPAAQQAVPELRTMAGNTSEVESGRAAAIRSLVKLDPIGALPTIVAAMDESGCLSSSARWRDPDAIFDVATRALIEAGPRVASALQDGLDDGRWIEGSRRRVGIVLAELRKEPRTK
jgi:HEAT repeat protein